MDTHRCGVPVRERRSRPRNPRLMSTGSIVDVCRVRDTAGWRTHTFGLRSRNGSDVTPRGGPSSGAVNGSWRRARRRISGVWCARAPSEHILERKPDEPQLVTAPSQRVLRHHRSSRAPGGGRRSRLRPRRGPARPPRRPALARRRPVHEPLLPRHAPPTRVGWRARRLGPHHPGRVHGLPHRVRRHCARGGPRPGAPRACWTCSVSSGRPTCSALWASPSTS